MKITLEEASEIIKDMSVSDFESQANPDLIRSIGKKIIEVYPELKDSYNFLDEQIID